MTALADMGGEAPVTAVVLAEEGAVTGTVGGTWSG
jgi:hypothetical protein